MNRSRNRLYFIIGAACLVAVAITVAVLWRNDDDPSRISDVPAKTFPVVPDTKVLIGEPADSSLIYAILTPVPPLDHGQLIHRIDGLPDSLTESESMLVCRALHDGLPSYTTLAPEQRHHIANQLMDALLRQQAAGSWLAEELTAIWRSKNADETIRDYALQHLAELMEGRRSPSTHVAAWRATGLPVLLAAARNTKERSAGTAILALHFLTISAGAPAASVVAAQEFEALLDEVANDGAAHSAARASALQVAAARGRAGLLATARALASDPAVPSGLRVAAIHYLGVCGASSDTTLLSAVEAENDLRFVTTCRAARTRLLSKPH